MEKETDLNNAELKLHERESLIELRNQAICELQTEVAELKTTLLAENDRLKMSFEAVEIKQRHNSILEARLAEYNSKAEAAQKTTQSQDGNFPELQSRLESGQRQLLQNNEVLQAKEKLLEERQALIESLEKQLQKAALDHKAQENTVEKLRIQTHQLQLGEQDADATIETLRDKIQSLVEENTNLQEEIILLKKDLKSAEDGYDAQVKLASETAARRRLSLGISNLKRERDDGDVQFITSSPSKKKRWNSNTIVKSEVCDLTGE